MYYYVVPRPTLLISIVKSTGRAGIVKSTGRAGIVKSTGRAGILKWEKRDSVSGEEVCEGENFEQKN